MVFSLTSKMDPKFLLSASIEKRAEIDTMLRKRFKEWTDEELEYYVSKDLLRAQEAKLLENEKELIKNEGKRIENEKEMIKKENLETEKENLETQKENLLIEERVCILKEKSVEIVELTNLGKAASLEISRSFICIPQIFTAHLGRPFDTDLLLFKRQHLSAEMNFLTERVVHAGKVGWVVGPPGTGKSVAAFASARQMAELGWRSTWLNFRGRLNTSGVQFYGSEWFSGTVKNVPAFIKSFDSSTGDHIVFLDGYKSNDSFAHEALKEFYTWSEDEKIKKSAGKRRLAVISSMAARNVKPQEDLGLGIEQCFVESWSLEEFKKALKNQDLWNYVAPNIDAETDGSISDRVAAKHYFSGGSARFMFQMNTEQVKSAIDFAIKRAPDISKYLGYVIGDASDSVVNTLLGSNRSTNGNRYSFIVSHYASRELGIKCGPEAIRSMAAAMTPELNPPMIGCFFEMLFFSNIQKGVLELRDKNRDVAVACLCETELVASVSPADSTLFNGGPKWVKPSKWNQAGFDAVHIVPQSKEIEFFQLTTAATHSLNLDHFSKFVSKLKGSKYSFKIFFVLPARSNDFKITPIGSSSTINHKDGQYTPKIRQLTMKGL